MKPKKQCLNCGKLFQKDLRTSKKNWIERTKYCSNECKFDWYRKNPEKNNWFKKGGSGFKGGKHSLITRLRLSGDNNHQWRGEEATYSPKHKWVKKWKGNSPYCVDCGENGKFIPQLRMGKMVQVWNIEWSNVDGKYRRHLEDYQGRCASCHKRYDLALNI